ncbi:hypothetical protein [Streptomyces sp. NPDC001492]
MTVVLDCAPETVDPIVALFTEAGAPTQSTPQRNLDGTAAASWLVVATIVAKQIPDTLRALAEFLTRDRVTRIEVGDLVLENPRPQDVDDILRRLGPSAGESAAGD